MCIYIYRIHNLFTTEHRIHLGNKSNILANKLGKHLTWYLLVYLVCYGRIYHWYDISPEIPIKWFVSHKITFSQWWHHKFQLKSVKPPKEYMYQHCISSTGCQLPEKPLEVQLRVEGRDRDGCLCRLHFHPPVPMPWFSYWYSLIFFWYWLQGGFP